MEGLPLEPEVANPGEKLARIAMAATECKPPIDSIDGGADNLPTTDDAGEGSTPREHTSWKGRTLELADVGELYARYCVPIRAFLAHMIGVEDASDVTQETFTRLIRRITDTNKRPIVITTYGPSALIYSIAKHLAVDELRRRGQRSIYSYDKLIDEADSWGDSNLTNAFTVATNGGAFEETLIDSMKVREALIGMGTARYREALLLYHCGFPYPDIAEMLGIKESGVKMFLSRARRQFREKFRELDQSA